MNNRNIERKRIEQISPTISTGDQIQGNELFMVSARDTNSANGYSTKKMGIQALKDYVLAGNTGNNEIVISNGGYEMYDTSENTDGTYSSISEYENSSNNYAWYLEVPRGGTLTKTVTKDCVVWIDGVGVQDDYNPNYNWTFYINNVKIYTFLFRNNNGGRAIYVKRGQELKLETQTYPIKLSVIPLASGGQFFIDTSIAPEQGTLTQNFTYEATRPTLFAHDSVPNVSKTTSAKINGKNVVPMEHGGYSHMSTYFILKTGDILTTVTYSNAAANYAAYALLEDGSGSGGNSGSSSCGYEIYDLPESDDGPIEEYESNSQRNYIRGLTISTLDGAQLASLTKTYSKNCEVLMTPLGGPSIEDDRGYVKIDNVRIPTGLLSLGVDYRGLSQFYVKAGQTLSIGYSGGIANVNVRPLKSGGNFFIDGSSELQEPFTSLSSVDTSTGTTFTFTAPKQTLFVWSYPASGPIAFGVTLNGKDINWKNHNNSHWYDKLILDTGDTIKFTFYQNRIYYCALPLLEASGYSDEMDSVQLWENGPYWATKNIGAKRDIDFGEYFQYGSLNGYRLENNVWVGNGSNKFSFDSDHCSIDEHTKSQLVSAGVITDGNVLTSEHDAATQKFGSQWKIPSSQEWLALNEHCDMLWTEKDGVKGVMITGKGNYSDKSIFLPDAGYANYYGWSDGFNWYSSTGVNFTVDSNKVNAREYAYHGNGVETANPGDINIRKIYVDMGCPIYYGLPIRPIKVVS